MKSAAIDIGNGTQLYYEECGRGPTIVLLHGMWASSRFFRHSAQGLQANYRVIALDLRGRAVLDDPCGPDCPHYAGTCASSSKGARPEVVHRRRLVHGNVRLVGSRFTVRYR